MGLPDRCGGQVLTVCRQQTSTEAAQSPPETPPSPAPTPSDIKYPVRMDLPVLPPLTDPRKLQEITDGTQEPQTGQLSVVPAHPSTLPAGLCTPPRALELL